MFPILTICAPPESSEWECFSFSCLRPQFRGSYTWNMLLEALWTALTLAARDFRGIQLLDRLRLLPCTPIDDRRRQREPLDAVEDRCEQVPRDSHLRQLERYVFRVPRHLGPDLDELLS